MINAIDHINLVVRDLPATVRFYTELLGFQQTNSARLEGKWIDDIVGLQGVQADVVFLELPGGGPRLEILQYLAPAGKSLLENTLPNTHGLRHIAFQVNDIAAMVQRLQAGGAKVLGQPVVVPGGILKKSSGQKTLCYFLDPEGVLLELAEYRPA